MHKGLVVIAAGLCVLLASSLPAPSPAGETTIFVALVASNVERAFEQLAKDFERRHRGVTIRAEYLGGTQIGDMIDQKVPADLVLVGSKITDPRRESLNPPRAVLRNREIILVPRSNPANIRTLRDLGNPGVRIAVGSSTAYVGQIASQVVQNAGADFGFAFVQRVRRNVRLEADRGSLVVGALRTGEANAAIAFQSERDDADCLAIPIDSKYNVTSTYVIAIPKNARNVALAQDLVEFVAGPAGRAVLHRFNFMPLQ